MSDDWSDESDSGDETGGMAARLKLMAQAKQAVASSAQHDMCPTCGKEVYMTADRQAFKGAFYHLACFICTKCGDPVRGGAHVEHESNVYCKSCYEKTFRPKGYGFGGGSGTLSSE